MSIKKRYLKRVFKLLRHQGPRKFAFRHPHKFLKIVATPEQKIAKRFQKYGYFSTLSFKEKNAILGISDTPKVASDNSPQILDQGIYYPIPILEGLGLNVTDYKNEVSKTTFSSVSPSSPVFSIIIPVYEQFEMTLECLKSIEFNYSKRSDIEIIIADDSEESDYKKELTNLQATHISIIRNETDTKGFLPNCNNASLKAKGDYIIFLNNDTLVLPGWLEGLERHLSDETMIVGSKLVYEDGVLQEAGGAIFNNGGAANIGKFLENDHPFYNFSRVSDYVSGASLCVNSKWFHSSGKFDDRYCPAYYEDTDLCVRAKKEGYKVVYSAESQIIHFEGRSCGTDTESTTGIKRFQTINKEKFLAKWDLTDYEPPVKAQEHYKLIHKKPTILVVCPYPVRTDSDSGSKRMYYIVEILQKYYDVVLYGSFSDNRALKTDDWVREMNLKGVEVITKDKYYSLEALLTQREFSLAWVSWLEASAYFLEALDRHTINLPWIYDTVDIHHIREARKERLSLDDKSSLFKETCYGKEMTTINRADRFIVVSEFEQNYLKKQYNLNCEIVGNIEREVAQYPYSPKDYDKSIAFIGSFGHEPNVTSIYHFLKTHWEQAVKLQPNLKLKIMGKGSEDHKERLEKYTNVTVLGWVASVEEQINDCKLTIVPLLHGAGVKGKINQSLALGIPVLSTRVGGEGMYNSKADCGIILADIEDFPEAIDALIENNSLLEKQSEAGKLWVEEICGFNTADKTIVNLLQNLN